MNRDNTIGYVYITKRLGNWGDLLYNISIELRAEQAAEQAQADLTVTAS